MNRHIVSLALGMLLGVAGCGKKSAAPVVDNSNALEKKVINSEDNAWKQAVADLKHKATPNRAKALRIITQYQASEAFPVLLTGFDDKTFSDGEIILGEPNSAREAAMIGLLKYGVAGEKLAVESGLPFLRAGLKDPSPGVKQHTLLAIALLGPKAKAAVGDVLLRCEEKDAGVRSAAFDTLQRIGGASPQELSLMLGNADPKIVYDAAKAINAIRPLPKEIVGALIQVLEKPPAEGDPDETILVRQEIAEALASLDKDAEPAIPVLINILKTTTEKDFIKFYRPKARDDAASRNDASPTMMALRKIGKPAVPALAEVVAGDNPFATWQAARVLAGIGPDAKEAIPALQKVFDREADRINSDVILMTACGLAIAQSGGDPGPIVARIAELLKISTPELRFEVARALEYFGRMGANAVPAVIKLLDDPEELIREQAIETLRAFGPAAKDAVPALGQRLADPNFNVRRGAVTVLTALGPIAMETAPALSKLLNEPDEAFRRDVLSAIIALGRGAKVDVGELGKLITASDERDRLLAIEALGSIGPDAKSAIPKLLAELKNLRELKRDNVVRAAIVTSLGQIGIASPDVVAALGASLTDVQMNVRLASVRSIALLGAPAKGAEAALRTFGGKSPDTAAGVWAAAALYKIGIDPDTNLQFIMNAFKNRSPAGKSARLAAMDAADLLGPDGKGLVPELIDSLNDKTPISPLDKTPVGIRAAQALGKMGPAAKDAVKKLTSMLKDSGPAQKKVVIETLGQIGPAATFAAARLREIARTEPSFAELAQQALEKIEPK